MCRIFPSKIRFERKISHAIDCCMIVHDLSSLILLLFTSPIQKFRYDVKVNPLDVEEIVWDIACLSRMAITTNNDANTNAPPPNKMSLPPGRSDRRKIMVRINNAGANSLCIYVLSLHKLENDKNS